VLALLARSLDCVFDAPAGGPSRFGIEKRESENVMALDVENVSLELIAALKPVMALIRKHDHVVTADSTDIARVDANLPLIAI
jgi:hypothetical protein